VLAALMDIARARGMSQLARDSGITREGLYKALSASGNPEFSTVLKVIKALKIKLHAAPVGKVNARKGARKKSSGELAAAGNLVRGARVSDRINQITSDQASQ